MSHELAVTALRLDEAIPLGHAFLARLARDNDVRLLALKGPVLELQGLRSPVVSHDVDVLVEPGGLDVLCPALEAAGWHDDGVYDTPGIIPLHSVNHHHRHWPCELDLHHWYPGFLAEPATVFDALWARRVTVELAHVDVVAPDPVAHAAVAALHYLRGEATTWGAQRLDALVEALGAWDGNALADLAGLAAATGAAETLGPLLDRLDAPRPPDRVPLAVPLAHWHLMAHATSREVVPWLVGLSRTPWRRRPAFVWRGVWLDQEHFGSAQEPRALRRARARRLRRAVVALPAAARELRRLRRARDV